ncbi:MAG: sigma-70 family RNA polymerase sigma factor [Myxococcota bacterium]|nr:sigma-70 family RNA polymerase sigma factor [Myxococcota bacterium]
MSIFNILPFRRRPAFDFDTLYRTHAGMVARRVSRFVRRDEVEEVVQEVFLKAFERRASFRGDASPVTWLYHIATNHCLNRMRDTKRRRQSFALNRDLPWLSPTTKATVQEQVLLEQLWRTLSESQAIIATYYFVDGLTHAEIARLMGVSRRTIGNRIDELTARMRMGMEETR